MLDPRDPNSYRWFSVFGQIRMSDGGMIWPTAGAHILRDELPEGPAAVAEVRRRLLAQFAGDDPAAEWVPGLGPEGIQELGGPASSDGQIIWGGRLYRWQGGQLVPDEVQP